MSKLEKAQDAATLYMGTYPEGVIHGTGRGKGVINVYGTTVEVLDLVPDTIDGFKVEKIVSEPPVLQ
jgi:hypothetical protein